MKGILLALGLATCVSTQAAALPSEKDVLVHYADLAHAMYQDAFTTAKALQQKINALAAHPAPATLEAARIVWVEALHPSR